MFDDEETVADENAMAQFADDNFGDESGADSNGDLDDDFGLDNLEAAAPTAMDEDDDNDRTIVRSAYRPKGSLAVYGDDDGDSSATPDRTAVAPRKRNKSEETEDDFDNLGGFDDEGHLEDEDNFEHDYHDEPEAMSGDEGTDPRIKQSARRSTGKIKRGSGRRRGAEYSDQGDTNSGVTRSVRTLRKSSRFSGVGPELLEHPAVRLGSPIAAILFFILWLGALMFSGGGVSSEELLSFYSSVEQGDLVGAEDKLELMDIDGELKASLTQSLENVRIQALQSATSKAKRSFKAKKYQAALGSAQKAYSLENSANMRFIAAESLRHLTQHSGAAAAYAVFTESFPADARYDDALFWQAESLRASGDVAGAKKLYREVSELRGSDFRRSAGRILGELSR